MALPEAPFVRAVAHRFRNTTPAWAVSLSLPHDSISEEHIRSAIDFDYCGKGSRFPHLVLTDG
jgi:hypothetical protein